MTTVTFQDGAVVLRDGKVGTGLECCCEKCVCPQCDNLTVSVSLDYCGLTASLVIPIPGADSDRAPPLPGPNDPFDPDEDFIFLDGDIICGELGPGGQCGWLLSLLVCYKCGNDQNGEGFTAFIAQGEDGCPELGPIDLVCFGDQFNIPCLTAPVASIG
jgi:hypothetical protein